jgi:predicted N-formylglutamate amidohydrolase
MLILSSEHGGAGVPSEYRALFRGHAALLRSHRGWDIGSLALARSLSRSLRAPLLVTTVTRLLVECNRSIGHPDLFSPISRALDASERQRVLDRYYFPHRRRITLAIADAILRGQRAVHIGVHSFTPILQGRKRHADIGLLYDPSHEAERRFCAAWEAELRCENPDLVVRANYPYLGKTDGLTTSLRRLFGPTYYLGIELEVNQRLLRPTAGTAEIRMVHGILASSLARASKEYRSR